VEWAAAAVVVSVALASGLFQQQRARGDQDCKVKPLLNASVLRGWAGGWGSDLNKSPEKKRLEKILEYVENTRNISGNTSRKKVKKVRESGPRNTPGTLPDGP